MPKIIQQGKATPEEKEIINIAIEEALEVGQAFTKILRFGFESCHPDNPFYSNRAHLTEELGDLLCMVKIIFEKNMVDSDEVLVAANKKLDKLRNYSDIDLTNIEIEK